MFQKTSVENPQCMLKFFSRTFLLHVLTTWLASPAGVAQAKTYSMPVCDVFCSLWKKRVEWAYE